MSDPENSAHGRPPAIESAGRTKAVPHIDAIQYLRGISALMVVCHHAFTPKEWLFVPAVDLGRFGSGVDVFFVISGFVMYVAARDERPAAFMVRRIIRVVPMYWLVTLAIFVFSHRTSIVNGSLGAEWIGHVAQSLLFIPHANPSHPGTTFPFLIPGWTLNYEMFFYLVFSVGLLLGRPLALTSSVFCVLAAIGVFVLPTGLPIVDTYTNSVVLEFVAGLWLGRLHVASALPKRLGYMLPAAFLGLLFFGRDGGVFVDATVRLVFSSLIVASAVAMSRSLPDLPLLRAIGDASYSIYLTHCTTILVFGKRVMAHVPCHGWTQFALWVAASVVLSSCVGWVVYVLIERPMTRWCRRVIRHMGWNPSGERVG